MVAVVLLIINVVILNNSNNNNNIIIAAVSCRVELYRRFVGASFALTSRRSCIVGRRRHLPFCLLAVLLDLCVCRSGVLAGFSVSLLWLAGRLVSCRRRRHHRRSHSR